ncbi:hypothetical protein O6H91_Y191500 [Diphasiastrum complanatum]|nr:hypothetical protein O6H91_Y191500 [Diphasiastrum complanatum]
MEDPTQLVYAFLESSTRRKADTSSHNKALGSHATDKTQVLASCSMEAVNEEGAGQTLLLESQDYRSMSSNQVQDCSSDCVSGDTQILSDSDDELVDQPGTSKEGKSVYELWKRKRSALNLTDQPSMAGKGDDISRPVAADFHQADLGFDPVAKLVEVVASDASTENGEDAEGNQEVVDSDASTTSGANNPAGPKEGAGVVGEWTSGLNLMELLPHHESCDAMKDACLEKFEENGYQCTLRKDGSPVNASQSTIKQQQTAPLPSNEVAFSGNHMSEDGPDIDRQVGRANFGSPCTATSKDRLRNIASVRASSLHTTYRADERATKFPFSQGRNDKQEDFQRINSASEPGRSDTGHFNCRADVGQSYIETSPAADGSRQLCIDMPPVCSETKKSVDIKKLSGPEVDVNTVAAVNIQTQAEECRGKEEFAGQGRKVRKLLFEDGEIVQENSAQHRQVSVLLESDQIVHIDQMQHELEEKHDVLDSKLHSKLNELSYLDSYEPGEESQANALAMVDKLVWLNTSGCSQEPVVEKDDRTEGALSKKRWHQSAQVEENKNSKETMKVFDWVDSQFNEAGFTNKVQAEKSKRINYGECNELKGSGLRNKKLKKLVRQDKVAKRKPGSLKQDLEVVEGANNIKPRNPSRLRSSNVSTKKMNCSNSFEKVTAVDVKVCSDPKAYPGDGGSSIPIQNTDSTFSNSVQLLRKSPQGGLAQAVSKVAQRSLCDLRNTEEKTLHESKLDNGAKEIYKALEHLPISSRITNECLSYSDIGSDTQIAIEAIHIMGRACEPENKFRADQVDTDKSLQAVSKDRVTQSESRLIEGGKKGRRVSWSGDIEIVSRDRSTPRRQSVSSKVRSDPKIKLAKNREVKSRRVNAKLKRLESKTSMGHVGKTKKSAKLDSYCSTETMRTSTIKAKKEQPSSKPSVVTGGVSTRSARHNHNSFEIQGGSTSEKTVKEKSCCPSIIRGKSVGANLDGDKEVKSILKRPRTAMMQKRSTMDSSAVDLSSPLSGHEKKVRAVVSAKEHSDEGSPQQKPLGFSKMATRSQRPMSNLKKVAAPFSGSKSTATNTRQDNEHKSLKRESIVPKEVSPSEGVKLRRRSSSSSKLCSISDTSQSITGTRIKGEQPKTPARVGARGELSGKYSKVSGNNKPSHSSHKLLAPTVVEDASTSKSLPKKRFHFLKKRKASDTVLDTPCKSAAISRDAINGSIERKRRKREPGNVNVLFSHGVFDEIVKQQHKILKRLGGRVTTKATECTHFVTDKFVRTGNMLEVMAAGKSVVTVSWLESCGLASYFVDEKNFILQDSKKEKELGFSMQSTLAASQQKPVLQVREAFTYLVKVCDQDPGQSVQLLSIYIDVQDWKVYVTPTTKPEAVRAIVQAAGGKVSLSLSLSLSLSPIYTSNVEQ